MKSKHMLLNSKAVIACILSGAIIYSGCKKDTSVETPEPTITQDITAVDSTSVSAAAVRPLEGFGTQTQGGTGKPVYRVTNLNASGTGSLAAALGSNRTVVFDVGGTISNFRWTGNNVTNLTIDGTTAPAPGITLDNNNNGNNLAFENGCHDIIVKNIRAIDAGNDNFSVTGNAYNIVFDHVSASGGRDGNLDITAGAHDVTVQYSILGTGGPTWSGNMLIAFDDTKNISVHHNLFLSKTPNEVGERNPLIHNQSATTVNFLMVDYRNNVVYNWGRQNGTGSGYGVGVDFGGTVNVINNYFQSAAAPGSAITTNANPDEGVNGAAYASGNISGNSGVNPDTKSNHAMWSVPAAGAITMQSACEAAAIVKAEAGCQPINATDQALLNQVVLTGCSGTPTNTPPTVNAGTDRTITLPTNSVTLTGTASDPNGTIASYAWTKVSGPSGGTIASPSSASTNITGLTQGTYVFNLRVTDNGGATANDNVTVTVNSTTPPANTPPTVNAGTDRTITLPTNSVTLTGTASDADGTIASYAWTKVSGPSGGTIASASSASTNITGLTQGTYVFNLRATDNGGASANDNVTVTVNAATPPPNTPPTVNAGTDRTITLPTNSVTLTGTASDANGTIASYAWTKVSGPSGGSIASPSSASTNITGLTQGTYVFNLRVTDNGGASANDNVSVIVNAATTPPPSSGTLTYSQGYNSSSSVTTNTGRRNSVSTSRYFTGPGSFRSEVRASEANMPSGYRGEMEYKTAAANPTEGVIEYDVYYENWTAFGGGGSCFKWHPNSTQSGISSVLLLMVYDGKFKVTRTIDGVTTYQSGTLQNVTPNKWYKMRWEVKWSNSNNGYVRLYIDGALYYSFTGRTTDANGTPFLKVGQNRWNIPAGQNTVVYYDNLKVYKVN